MNDRQDTSRTKDLTKDVNQAPEDDADDVDIYGYSWSE